jgi:hypothetical protein
MIKALIAFLEALPELLRLIKNIQQEYEKRKIDKKVKDDIKQINKAFETGDIDLLNDIFNGVSNKEHESTKPKP